MTYCVGLLLDAGMVLLSDTRTNAGLDNISTYRKTFVFETPGERVITIMTALARNLFRFNFIVTDSMANLSLFRLLSVFDLFVEPVIHNLTLVF